MKDEIKEILDKMKNYSGECHSILAYSICGYKKKIRGDFRMCMNDIDLLLDYITNLQEENEIKNTNLKEVQDALDNIGELIGVEQGMSVEDVYDKIKELKITVNNCKQENERLKTKVKTQIRNRKEQTHKKNIYKLKCEKALAKINNMFDLGNENTIIDDLLQLENILKGSDKDCTD